MKLKKILLTLMVILAVGATASAAPIRFGVKAGLNVNKLKFNKDIAKADNSCGWTAGVMAEFTVPIIGIGMDASVMYSRMNNNSDAQYTSSTSVANNDLYGKNFIQIPVNVKYKLSLPVISNYIVPYLYTGPNFGLRMGKSFEDAAQNLKSKTFQLAWNVGLGVELIKHLQISASYGFGINNIVNKLNVDLPINVDNSKAKNNYWTVTAGWMF